MYTPGPYLDFRAQPCAVVIDDIEDKTEIAMLLLSQELHAWLNQKAPSWKPKFPASKKTHEPVQPPVIN